MIDEDRTMQLYGYTSDTLTHGSRKKVVAVCEGCGKYRIQSMSGYKELCKHCAQILRHKLPEPKYIMECNRFINGTLIDRIETIKEYGYDPIDLLPKSMKPIISFCEGCGERRTTSKNSYKPLCHECKLATPETKKLMSIANSRPRGPMPEEQKKNITKALKGKKHPPRPQEWCDNISKGKLGKPTKLKGFERTFEQKKLQSAIGQGIPIEEWTGFSDHDRHNWAEAIYLNKPFIGCHRHHLTETTIIHIPAELHMHIPHNLLTGENMDVINATALQFMA